MARVWTLAVAVAVALAGCGSRTSTAPRGEGGVHVQGIPDGGAAAGGGDGDGGTPNDGGPDAGAPDGGFGGPATDGGAADGGPADGGPADGGQAVIPPWSQGGWTVYGADQGLSPDVHDVSADEAGNVYVAAYDALYVKRRDDLTFQRFDDVSGGLTRNCSSILDEANPANCPNRHPESKKDAMCPVISVAGGAPGVAAVGFQGRGTDGDADLDWCLDSGGVDLVAFDGTTLTRTRHVLVASPPHVMCEHWVPGTNNQECYPWDDIWQNGRRKMRQLQRLVVNHGPGRVHGDLLMGGTHGTFAILVAHPDERNWSEIDKTVEAAKTDPKWNDARYVWEHEHPANVSPDGRLFLTGEAWALAFEPGTNIPWGANEHRTARLPGYARMSHPTWNAWWGDMDPPRPFMTFWVDAANTGYLDAVTSFSFCKDGTLWIGSLHGLARRDPGGGTSSVGYPFGTGIGAVACDDDGSVWVGSLWGDGLLRLVHGAWTTTPAGAPASVKAPVRSIQIDHWSSPRVVYAAHLATRDKAGHVIAGGVTAYSGP